MPFSPNDEKRIARSVRQTERIGQVRDKSSTRKAIPTNHCVQHAILEIGDLITAREGAIPGTGEVYLEYYDGTSMIKETEPTEILNPYRTEIGEDAAASTVIQLAYGDDGRLWLVGVGCG